MPICDILQAVLAFDEPSVKKIVRAEIEAETDPQTILNDGLITAMDEVGRLFSAGDLFVPEMLMAAQAMKAGLEVVMPLLVEGNPQGCGKVVIGTVKGDLHDIGKNLVAMMMKGAGFDVIDVGVDVDAVTFMEKAREHSAQVVAISALLTTTMAAMEETIRLFHETGTNAKIIVGGAPVTYAFAKKIQADGYAEDAPSAVELARKLVAG